MNVVGIVCALTAEARYLGAPTRRHQQLATLADGTLLAVTGMGRSAAAAGAGALVSAGATALASWGMAGGLDPALAPGAVLLPNAVVGPDGERVLVSAEWRSRLSAAIAARHAVSEGTLLSSETAISSPAEKARLFQRTGASAVDMESLAIAEVAQTQTLPFVAVRVIVDAATDALPRAVTAAADDAGHLHIWRLIGALALTPGDLTSLIRLAWRYRAASRSLATVGQMGSFASYVPG